MLVLGAVPMVVGEVILVNSYRESAVSGRSVEAQNQCRILANQLLNYNYLEDPSSELMTGELSQFANIYDGRVIVIDKDYKVVEDTYGLIEGKYVVSEEVILCFQGQNTNQLSNQRYIEMTVPVKQSGSDEVLGVMLVSVSTDSIWDAVDTISFDATIYAIVSGVIVLALALLASNILVKPVGRVAGELKDIAAGHSTADISVPAYTETEEISESFNQITNQMRLLDESRQEFVSNVSHELKTPLTSMKLLADSILTQPDVPVEIYKEFMSDIAEEIDREDKIINDLLSLVKMDRTASGLNISSVDVNALLENILKMLRPIAAGKNVEMVLESFRPVTAGADEGKLTLAFTNLIENAIKYNKDGGWVHVSLDADHQSFYVKVEDSGLGIPADSIDYVFERFYRVDKSHSNEIDGTGLGLAITRSAVLLHKGTIKVKSVEGEGTVFTVRIPLNYIGVTEKGDVGNDVK